MAGEARGSPRGRAGGGRPAGASSREWLSGGRGGPRRSAVLLAGSAGGEEQSPVGGRGGAAPALAGEAGAEAAAGCLERQRGRAGAQPAGREARGDEEVGAWGLAPQPLTGEGGPTGSLCS